MELLHPAPAAAGRAHRCKQTAPRSSLDSATAALCSPPAGTSSGRRSSDYSLREGRPPACTETAHNSFSRRTSGSGGGGQQRVGPCAFCETHDSPLFREGPTRYRQLCNACALRWKRQGMRAFGLTAAGGARKRRTSGGQQAPVDAAAAPPTPDLLAPQPAPASDEAAVLPPARSGLRPAIAAIAAAATMMALTPHPPGDPVETPALDPDTTGSGGRSIKRQRSSSRLARTTWGGRRWSSPAGSQVQPEAGRASLADEAVPTAGAAAAASSIPRQQQPAASLGSGQDTGSAALRATLASLGLPPGLPTVPLPDTLPGHSTAGGAGLMAPIDWRTHPLHGSLNGAGLGLGLPFNGGIPATLQQQPLTMAELLAQSERLLQAARAPMLLPQLAPLLWVLPGQLQHLGELLRSQATARQQQLADQAARQAAVAAAAAATAASGKADDTLDQGA